MNMTNDQILRFFDLEYGIKSTKILHSVSGEAKSGEMLAVMGASGSGKTTLLNILSGRLPPTSGKITLNGRSFTKAMKRNLAYVLQADIFLPRLTLWETLYFSAMVYMPDTVPKSDKLARINDIARSLDLTKCLQTVIGDEFTRGLSGGEKKRANIACELLADPEILLVDEPTSGLDSNTALRMMEMLWKLVHTSNKIMITTIHQPSSHIFHMFSSLLLLVDGHTAYFGDGKKAIEYFADLGFCCEENYNPADFLLQLMRSEVSVVNKIILSAERKGASHSLEEVRESTDRSPRADSSNMEMQAVTDIRLEIEQNVGENTFAKNQEGADIESKRKWRTSFWTQFRTLTWRNLRQSKRRLFNLHGAIHTFLIGFFAGVLYYQIDRSLNTFRDRMGVIFFGVVYMGFGMMEIAVAGFSEDRDVVNKDRNSNMYRLSAYYVAKIVSELPHVFVTPFFFFTYVYWISSLGDVTGFFLFLGMNFLSCLLAQSMGHMIGASVTNARAGIMSANTYMLISALLGGFFITNFPSWLEWSRYLAISHYPFAVMVTVILGDQPVSRCNISIPEDSSCSTSMTNVTEVEYLLQDVGIQLPVYCYIAMMCLLTVLFILAGYIFLRIRGPKVRTF